MTTRAESFASSSWAETAERTRALVDKGVRRWGRWRRKTLGRLRRDPLRIVGVAAAAGFVLGGGLATRTGFRLLRRSAALALQLTVVPALVGRLKDAIANGTGGARLAR